MAYGSGLRSLHSVRACTSSPVVTLSVSKLKHQACEQPERRMTAGSANVNSAKIVGRIFALRRWRQGGGRAAMHAYPASRRNSAPCLCVHDGLSTTLLAGKQPNRAAGCARARLRGVYTQPRAPPTRQRQQSRPSAAAQAWRQRQRQRRRQRRRAVCCGQRTRLARVCERACNSGPRQG